MKGCGQLQGSGRGNLAAYNPESWTDLTQYMEEHPIRDGDKWLAGLVKKNQMLGGSGIPYTVSEMSLLPACLSRCFSLSANVGHVCSSVMMSGCLS